MATISIGKSRTDSPATSPSPSLPTAITGRPVASLTAAVGGTFTLTFGSAETAPIAFNASAADVQSALTALTTVGRDAEGEDNVSVTRVGGTFRVTFVQDLGGQPVDLLALDGTTLVTVRGASVDVMTAVEGEEANEVQSLKVGIFINVVQLAEVLFLGLGQATGPVSADAEADNPGAAAQALGLVDGIQDNFFHPF